MGDSEVTTTSTTTPVSPEASQAAGLLLGGVQDIWNQGASPFGQSLYAGLSDTTQGGIQGLLDASGNPTFADGINGALGHTANIASGGAFGMNDPGYANVRQGAIDTAITSANSPFLSSGTFGSDKHRESLGRGITSAVSELDYTNHQNDIARQERAQQALPGLLSASLLPSQIQLTAGGLLDADANATLAGEADLHDRLNSADLNLLTQLSQILAGTAGAAGSTTTQTEPTPPWWMGALGLGLQAL